MSADRLMPQPIGEGWHVQLTEVSLQQLLVYLSTTLPRCLGRSTQRGGWDAI